MNITAAYTDLYQITMAQVYFGTKPDGRAVFDYYFRHNTFKSGYSIFAGLEDVLDILETLEFSSSDISYLEQKGFESDFLDYLKNFRFKGNIYSSKEGDVVFPNRPILQVEANIIEAQIIETLLLNILNFQTLIATKASRILAVLTVRVMLKLPKITIFLLLVLWHILLFKVMMKNYKLLEILLKCDQRIASS